MKRTWLLSCCAVVVTFAAAFVGGGQAYAAPANTERHWLAPDFFVDTSPIGDYFALSRHHVTDCRAQIEKAICVRGTPFENRDMIMSRGCMANPRQYITFFQAVYDRLPPVLQQVFCSVETLSVEPNLESIAYAGLRGGGAVVGFRKSVIDENLDLSTLLSWKEQLPFGGDHDSYDLKNNLPLISEKSAQAPTEDLAFYVLVHEFAHLLDFANDINTRCFGENCNAAPGSWTALSWITTQRPKANFDFPYRKDVCYYGCGGRVLSRSSVPALYAGLNKTGFVTVYAATNVYDDFAESLAFYYLHREGDFIYTLDTRQGNEYDMLAKVGAKPFAEKYRYIEHFLARDDIAYP